MPYASSRIALRVLSACLALAALPSCTSAAPPRTLATPAEARAELDAIERQLASLESAIENERSKVVTMLSAPPGAERAPLSEDAEFRSVTNHLAALELELTELRERQATLQRSRKPGPQDASGG